MRTQFQFFTTLMPDRIPEGRPERDVGADGAARSCCTRALRFRGLPWLTFQASGPDVFISYGHVDDDAPTKDWVATLHTYVLGKLKSICSKDVEVWRDTRLGQDRLDDAVKGAISQSAVFISVLSPGFVQGDWCTKEAGWFLAASGSDAMVDGKSRLVHTAVKTPLVDVPWPAGLDDGTLHYRFYDTDEQSQLIREYFGRGRAPHESGAGRGRLQRADAGHCRRPTPHAPAPRGAPADAGSAADDLRGRRDTRCPRPSRQRRQGTGGSRLSGAASGDRGGRWHRGHHRRDRVEGRAGRRRRPHPRAFLRLDSRRQQRVDRRAAGSARPDGGSRASRG